MNDWSVLSGPLAMVIVAMFSAEWVFISWLSKQFAKVYTKMDELAAQIFKKLEYHERHDDKRFSDINDNLWELRLSNATRDAKWLDRRPRSSLKNDNGEEISQSPL